MIKMSDSVLEEQRFAPLQEELRMDLGKGRALRQIKKTVIFDGRRNFKKLIAMILINTLFVILFLIINVLRDQPPEEATDYVISYLQFFSFLMLITAIYFGG